ncbi:MAG: YitT family protein, partial [Acutalibacteraceae bacterium]
TKTEIGKIKVVFDISCVTFSVILSLLFFDMKIVGTREGTILSAVLTGFVIKFFSKLLKNKIERILVK